MITLFILLFGMFRRASRTGHKIGFQILHYPLFDMRFANKSNGNKLTIKNSSNSMAATV